MLYTRPALTHAHVWARFDPVKKPFRFCVRVLAVVGGSRPGARVGIRWHIDFFFILSNSELSPTPTMNPIVLHDNLLKFERAITALGDKIRLWVWHHALIHLAHSLILSLYLCVSCIIGELMQGAWLRRPEKEMKLCVLYSSFSPTFFGISPLFFFPESCLFFFYLLCLYFLSLFRLFLFVVLCLAWCGMSFVITLLMNSCQSSRYVDRL